MASASLENLQESLQPLGLWRQKAHALLVLSNIVEKLGGELPCSRRDLGRLPGTGSYTVGAVMAAVYGLHEPLVDVNMARYVAALLGGGSNEHGSVLKPATLATMFAPHYQADPRVPGMGLGFFRSTLGGHPVVEHQGILPGFNSQIWLAPGDGIGVLAFTNGASNTVMWMPGELPGLLGHLLGVPAEGIRTDVPQHPEIWKEICGWYSLSVPITDPRSRLYVGAGAEVLARRGELIFRLLTPIPALSRGFPLHPDDEEDPYVFRIDFSGLGTGVNPICRFMHTFDDPFVID